VSWLMYESRKGSKTREREYPPDQRPRETRKAELRESGVFRRRTRQPLLWASTRVILLGTLDDYPEITLFVSFVCIFVFVCLFVRHNRAALCT
jgi:hypothetical protein